MGNYESSMSDSHSDSTSVNNEDSKSENSDSGVGTRIFQFKVSLKGIKPPIWRRVQVLEDTSFFELHGIINSIMGWQGYHLYQFRASGGLLIGEKADHAGFGGLPRIRSSNKIKISKIFSMNNRRMTYVYDFGDNWEHSVLLEKIISSEEGIICPRVIRGKRACPPEDCGGVWGYAELLNILRDPEHKEHADRKEWMEECGHTNFDPEHFDLEACNKWVKKSWNALPAELIEKYFKACGLTVALDGSKDTEISCFKEGNFCRAGWDMLVKYRDTGNENSIISDNEVKDEDELPQNEIFIIDSESED